MIDGQQRLTTLLILQAAIRDAANEASGTPLVAQHGLFWVRDANNAVEGPRIQAQENDHPTLERAMESQWRQWYSACRRRKDLESARGLYAYAYFRFNLWLGRQSFLDDEQDLVTYRAAQQMAEDTAEEVWSAAGHSRADDALSVDLVHLQSMLDKLSLLVLRLQNTDEDAPTIFESINAKRTELQQWDFIRNLIFTRFSPAEAHEIFEGSWKEVQTRLEKINWDGKRSESRDAFVYDYLIARGEQAEQGSIGKNRGYYHLRARMARLLPSTADPQYRERLADFVKADLLSAARSWPMAVGAQTSPIGSPSKVLPADCRGLIEGISKISSGPPFPAVLHYVEGWSKGRLTDAELAEILKLLENFLVRMVVTRQALSPLRALFMQLMNTLSKDYSLEELQSELLSEKPGMDHALMPSDEDLLDHLRNKDFYRSGLTGGQLGALFRGIERQMSGSAANPLPYGRQEDDFTVEHVFPQSCVEAPHGAWAAEISEWDADAAAMGIRINKIGNLTLLTFKANRYLRAKSFRDKQAVFNNQVDDCPHPLLSISKDLVDVTRWDAEAIDARTELLAQRVLKRWPLPS